MARRDCRSRKQLQDLRLHGDVECGGRLIGDQQLRLARDRHRDHRALPHSARERVRIGVDVALRVRNAGEVEQLDRAGARLRAARAAVRVQRLGDLLADGQHRVEAGHRLLEHHADLAAAHGQQIALAERSRSRPSSRTAACGRHEAQQRQRGARLAAARTRRRSRASLRARALNEMPSTAVIVPASPWKRVVRPSTSSRLICPAPWSRIARVEGVGQRLADQADAEHGQHDGEAGDRRHGPGRCGTPAARPRSCRPS